MSPWRAGLVLPLLLCVVSTGRAALPVDLDAVPRDAAGFLHVRAAELWASEPFTEMRRTIGKAGEDVLKDFQKMFEPRPGDIDRVTVVFPSVQSVIDPLPEVEPEARSALGILTCKQPIDKPRLMKQLQLREKKHGERPYYFNEDMWAALIFLDDKTILLGSEDSVFAYLEGAGKKQAGPLQSALEEAARPHLLVLGVNPQLLAKHELAGFLPPPFKPLLAAHNLTITLDYPKKLDLNLRFDFPAEQAKAGEDALRAALDMGRMGLGMLIKQVDDQFHKKADKVEFTEMPARFAQLLAVGFLRDIDDLVKNTPIERKGGAVSYHFQYGRQLVMQNSGLLSLLGASYLVAQSQIRAFRFGVAEEEGKPEERLRKLADAIEAYRKDKGHYPPPALYSAQGQPLLSWRVAILPYLGEEALYKEFKLDESWDSPHNKKLIKKMPKAFWADRLGKRLKTADMVFTGPDTPFEGTKGIKADDIDAETILFVEAVSAEKKPYWTKPSDIVYKRGESLGKLFDEFSQGNVRAILKNGKYKTFMTEDQIQSQIERRKK